MANKFYGIVGYATDSVETRPGVWSDAIIERNYYGDVVRNSRKLQEGEYLNDDITVDHSIRIVADAYAQEHFFAIRYIQWAGTLWKVANVTVESPRLLLRLGGVYHGPRPEEGGTPGDSGEPSGNP